MPKYMLKTVNEDMTAYRGFVWPEAGEVVAPDWSPNAKCGNGLHGALGGEGDGRLFNWSADARWLVCEIADDTQIVDLNGKVKVERCTVIHCGDKDSALKKMIELGCMGPLIGGTSVAGYHGTATAGDYGTSVAGYHGTATAGDYGTSMAGDSGTATAGECGTATAGDRGTATAGDYGTATAGECGTSMAGYHGTATAGDCGTATAGDSGTATAGECGTATAGDYGTATAGDSGTATAGDCGTATAGDRGTATAGYRGTATAGDYGTSMAGYHGTATAGECGTATAGDRGILNIKWYDGDRYRLAVGYVGEDGLEPNVPYVVEKGKFIRADAA